MEHGMEAQPPAAAAGMMEAQQEQPAVENQAGLPATEPGVALALPEQAGAAEGNDYSGVQVVNTREKFMDAWESFMDSRGLDAKIPLFNRNEIDLFKLFKLVLKGGGSEAVSVTKKWAAIGRQFNPPSSMTDLSFQIKKIFTNKLKAMEEAFSAGQLNIVIPLEGPVAEAPAPKASKAKAHRSAAAAAAAQEAAAVRSQRKRSSSHIPSAAMSPGALVGQRVGVYWRDDRQWYFGSVVGYNDEENTHHVEYDDGEGEWLSLDDEEWGLESEVLAWEAGGEGAGAGAQAAAAPRRGPGGPARKRAKAEEQAGGQGGRPMPPPGAPLLPGAAAGGYATPSTVHMFGLPSDPSPAPATIPTPYLPDPGRAAAAAAAAAGLLSGQEGYYFPPAAHAGGPAGGSGEGPPIPLPPGMQPRRQAAAGQAAAAAAAAEQQRQQAALGEMVVRSGAGQEMVASGSRYRAFTAATGPPGFEIFCWLPGVSIEEVHVRCWSNGRVLIRTDVRTQSQASFQEVVQLPARLDTRTAQALLTTAGHLYVRINRKPPQEGGGQGPLAHPAAHMMVGAAPMGVLA